MSEPIPSGEHGGGRSLERVAAAVLYAYALAQVVQAFIMTHAPAGDAAAARFAFAVGGLDRFRAIFLYAGFVGLPAAYGAVYRRLRCDGWAVVGLLWIAMFIALELINRAVELVALADWQRRWLALAADDPARLALALRIETVEALERASYLPLLATYALASLAFALALRARDRWSRLARLGFALNFVRATIRLGAMQLGIAWLAPVADAVYLPLTLAHALAVATWLALPAPALTRSGPASL